MTTFGGDGKAPIPFGDHPNHKVIDMNDTTNVEDVETDPERVEPFTTYSGDDQSHEEWKASQSPEGTISTRSSLRASRTDPTSEGER